MACSLPAQTGVPLARWRSTELAAEAVTRGVLESVPTSTVPPRAGSRPSGEQGDTPVPDSASTHQPGGTPCARTTGRPSKQTIPPRSGHVASKTDATTCGRGSPCAEVYRPWR